jgi:hypothetical protein
MSNEEMNKKMEFIVEHQAKFAADMEILRKAQAAETKVRQEQHGRLTEAFLGVVEIIGNLTRAQTRTDEGLKLLTAAQARADERLNIFINVVERYISGNGGSEGHA